MTLYKHFLSVAEVAALLADESLVPTRADRWYTSTCYDAESRKNVVDLKIRKSHSVPLTDVKQRQRLDQKLQAVAPSFRLLSGGGMHVIKYDKGDFFSRHTDHIHCPGDATFLLCLKACEAGGTLVLYPEGQEPRRFHLRVGSLLLFDKVIPHELLPVKKGQRLVIKSDALDMKAFPTDDDVLVIHDLASVRPSYVAAPAQEAVAKDQELRAFYDMKKSMALPSSPQRLLLEYYDSRGVWRGPAAVAAVKRCRPGTKDIGPESDSE